MEINNLVVTPAPHIKDKDTVPSIMKGVIIALLPATVGAVYFFGLYALALIAVCIAFALITEIIWLAIRKKDMALCKDASAILTGLLLAFTLPPTTPLWVAAVGSIVAISLGKQVFGGLGFNIFNPALIGRAFLAASFPSMMTNFVLDGYSTATPLTAFAQSGVIASYWELFVGSVGGCLGETSAFLLLLGGVYLIYKRLIDWRLPLGYLGAVAILSFVSGQDLVFHLLSGGLILGALYMITDPVTSPLGRKARWIYAIGAGFIVFVIRYWGSAPEGVLYSILLMNAMVPLLDKYFPDKVFGEVKRA